MAAQKEEIIIELSKKKLTWLIAGAIGFAALGLWVWSIADSQTRFNPVLAKGVAIGTIVFFGLCGIRRRWPPEVHLVRLVVSQEVKPVVIVFGEEEFH